MSYEYDSFMVAFGRRVREMRLARGLTVRDMVLRHGYHDSYWRRVESGSQGLSMRSMLRLADVFDVPLSELVSNVEGKPEAKKPGARKK
jgi:transcriptional regulator with XRE-family HTH domain